LKGEKQVEKSGDTISLKKPQPQKKKKQTTKNCMRGGKEKRGGKGVTKLFEMTDLGGG